MVGLAAKRVQTDARVRRSGGQFRRPQRSFGGPPLKHLYSLFTLLFFCLCQAHAKAFRNRSPIRSGTPTSSDLRIQETVSRPECGKSAKTGRPNKVIDRTFRYPYPVCGSFGITLRQDSHRPGVACFHKRSRFISKDYHGLKNAG